MVYSSRLLVDVCSTSVAINSNRNFKLDNFYILRTRLVRKNDEYYSDSRTRFQIFNISNSINNHVRAVNLFIRDSYLL